jgi:hypothetical protein
MNRMNTMKRTCGLLLTGAAVWLAAAGTAHAQRMVKTVTHVCTNIQDTSMLKISGRETWNYGSTPYLHLGTAPRKALLRFDLRALAGQYSSIERITLTVREDATQTNPNVSGTGTVFRILPANKSWVGGAAAGVAESGSACWNYKAYSATSPTNWAGSAGLSTAGTDYDAAALGSFGNNTSDSEWYSVNMAGDDAARRKSLVDEWSGNQADNAGVLVSETGSSYFHPCSINNATAANRPTLTVEYVPAGSPVAVFQQGVDGYAGTEDTFVASGALTNKNFGVYASLHIYGSDYASTRRPLIRFDLGALSRQYTGVESILLTNLAYAVPADLSTPGGTLAVHRILPANKDWVEGTGGNAVVAGAPCWDFKAYNTTVWAGSAGLSTAGTDYESAPLGSTGVPSAANFNYGVTLAASDPALRLALVSEWSGPKAGNAGLLLGIWGTNTTITVGSRENADVAKRPRLEVAYTAQETKTATFRNGVNGYAGIQDTSVLNVSGYAYKNFGKSPRLDLPYNGATDIRKVLMRFDLSSLRGRYAAIRRLRLTLTDSDEASNTASFSGTLRAYRVKPANKGWVEGTATGTGGAVNEGEPCWSNRAYSATSPVLWAGSPGLSTAGTDYDAVELGAVTGVLSMGGALTLELGNAAALVAEWSGNQADNAGILLVADALNLYGCSADHATVANKPLLEVEYVPVKGTLIRVN